jgi:hypothetical protein
MQVPPNDTTNRTAAAAAPFAAVIAPVQPSTHGFSEDSMTLSSAAVAKPAVEPNLVSQAASAVSSFVSSAKTFANEMIDDLADLVASTWATMARWRLYNQIVESSKESEKEDVARQEAASYTAQIANAAEARRAYAARLEEQGRQAQAQAQAQAAG